ncbi:bifunctional [glutamate--ammonia ligase]-adenylyl-L-tyrosine phosphorylase/[glutamate--ammonia-ligase] adenylyltransferase [Coralloluteibacterium stylophorae]|uniref:Bifunctional glutamine synthetase adenylyltransferase/adenylyl-removing enzyme n=2 Tax=Coralloluteibacterium stylophorae TaxID=1776034 RepID=A0AAP2CDE6_9GAMM|nr:bifunctional [glutamate--ammonia ligase]-adenylyl-L-tyrosine phosphorylase/[glutamate--ammonia-ligase] adenylyltransferase [Coralloluteibacterium stylophorae]MBS7458487.1 bifunctional [glutamate--ammonia ligase]-adenylyl-L-tyrosine phosphorylase/[glutamate--ammonia-ligase] adenylyltransferase [Coralloluteibacterium stylophorae]
MTDDPIDALVVRRLQALAEAGIDIPAARREAFAALALASDFAIDTLVRQPALAGRLDDPAAPPPALALENEADWQRRLRRWRAAESTRLIWRDVQGLDDVEATLAGCTRLAEQALAAALEATERRLAVRHGTLRTREGAPQRLVVFGLGKLGGGELNFSSDVDLVLAYPEPGETDGPTPLTDEAYATRVARGLVALLDEITADGFVHRVDLRLRPYGNAGRLALSFAAMEHYFQREGRDWERYAWIKARPVAGDVDAGEDLLARLRPFVYRRYLDFGALEGLREMKAMIAGEVARRELHDDVKRGSGGIREIEFLAQALQLVRGGQEPALRERRLLPALAALAEAGHLEAAVAARLGEAYRFLRRLENRLQMVGDMQTHELPLDAQARLRLARGLGHADWAALWRGLDAHRALVAREFGRLLAARRRPQPGVALRGYWEALPDAGDAQVLVDAGFVDAPVADRALRNFVRQPALRGLSKRGRMRMDVVMPALLQAAAEGDAPDAALPRLLALVSAVARRSSYLALLQEQPAALARLVDVATRSALLSERLAEHPLLMDELLDLRAAGPLPTPEEIHAQWERRCAHLDMDDTEQVLQAVNEQRQGVAFRIALALLTGRQDALAASLQLAELAQWALGVIVPLAEREVSAAHGGIAGSGLAVLGYGSFGGRELGFGSDLDLVFLYDAPADAVSDGARCVDAARWYGRLAQKIVRMLGTPTAAGRLYEVDVRLRPDGAQGMLVSSVASFAAYQRERAWTWERQALVRARPVAGDAAVGAAFEQVRAATLAQARDAVALREDVVRMRVRMRAELDRSRGTRFDLKQGEGGLADLEFLLQALVLDAAHADPGLLSARDSHGLLQAAGAAGVLEAGQVRALFEAHAGLLARSLACTLDARPRVVALDDTVEGWRSAVRTACRAAGLDFSVTAERAPRAVAVDPDAPL